MNLSIDLKGTMSPKVTRKGKCAKKTPTILALRKPLRRSSLPDLRRTDDIIVIDSTSSSSSSNDGNEDIQKVINETPLTIPDSDNDDDNNDENIVRSESVSCNRLSLRETNLKKINVNDHGTKQKNLEICKWLIEISNATTKQQRLTLFSELSTISGGTNPGYKKTGEKIALNSTAQNELVPRFDQLFRKKSVFHQTDTDNLSNHDNEQQKIDIIEDSLITTTNSNNDQNRKKKKVGSQIDSLGDSFKLQMEETLTKSPLRKKELSPWKTTPSNKDVESLLDSIYGNSWRKNQHLILLPSSDTNISTRNINDNNKNNKRNNKKKTVSEKKTKPQKSPIIHKNPYLDEEVVKSKNLLRTLQENRINEKLTASPWTKSLKKICDTESDNDSQKRRAIAKKLTFNENSDDDADDNDSKISNTDDDDDWLPVSTRQTIATKKKSGYYSFLESLSKKIPIDECDISARIFRNNFKKHKTELADRLFKLYNKEVFNGAIPETTKLEWNSRLTHTAGRCRCKKITHSNGTLERRVVIELSTKVLDSPDRLRDTLIHEMCHAATWIINQLTNGHGEHWKNWALKAMNTFPELPPIRICHNYALNTKYTYKCKNCSYSFGRHTKSLNLERKRCGYCHGEFEILINKTTKTGEIKSVPTTPKRPPTGFALFVKEKYSEFKTPDLKHSDVMKMLGEEFAKMKLKST